MNSVRGNIIHGDIIHFDTVVIEETIKLKQDVNYNTYKRLSVIFVFKQVLIGLKQNLREEDSLSTSDKWPVPKVSSVRRFYCI